MPNRNYLNTSSRLEFHVPTGSKWTIVNNLREAKRLARQNDDCNGECKFEVYTTGFLPRKIAVFRYGFYRNRYKWIH